MLTSIIGRFFTGSTTKGRQDVGLVEFSKAVNFMTELGIDVTSVYTNNGQKFTIVLDPFMDQMKWVNSFTVSMNQNTLITIYNKIKALGLSGRIIISSFIQTLTDLDEEEYSEICYAPEGHDRIKEYFEDLLRAYGISTAPKFGTMNTILVSFGNKNIKKLIYEGLLDLVQNEIHRSDENFEPLRHIYSACNICHHSRIDEDFGMCCKKCSIRVPVDMTAEEIGKVYPSVFVSTDNRLFTKWIVNPVPECDALIDRRPI